MRSHMLLLSKHEVKMRVIPEVPKPPNRPATSQQRKRKASPVLHRLGMKAMPECRLAYTLARCLHRRRRI